MRQTRKWEIVEDVSMVDKFKTDNNRRLLEKINNKCRREKCTK